MCGDDIRNETQRLIPLLPQLLVYDLQLIIHRDIHVAVESLSSTRANEQQLAFLSQRHLGSPQFTDIHFAPEANNNAGYHSR